MAAIGRREEIPFCQAYRRWVEAERKLAERPLLIKQPCGYIEQSPWLAIPNKQLEIMARYISELGFSPASRSRVSGLTFRPGYPSRFQALLGGH